MKQVTVRFDGVDAAGVYECTDEASVEGKQGNKFFVFLLEAGGEAVIPCHRVLDIKIEAGKQE